jgi:hypothetical protein
MIPHKDITKGVYKATWQDGKDKLIVIVTGEPPFCDVAILDTAYAGGTHVPKFEQAKKPIEFLEVITWEEMI